MYLLLKLQNFGKHKPFIESNLAQQQSLTNLMLYITKGCHPLSFVENPWLKHLVFHQCG